MSYFSARQGYTGRCESANVARGVIAVAAHR